MKIENIAKRINLARESRRKSLIPFINARDKMMPATELSNFVEEAKADKKIRYEARKYVIITCASCIETYFKRMAQIFINAGWIKENFQGILRHDKYSLADLLEINKGEFSLGEIISISQPLQDLESINHFYSRMLGIKNFLVDIETVEVDPEEGDKYTLKSEYPDYRSKIAELLKFRHLIVHHEGYKGILGLERLQGMLECVAAFISAADGYLLDKIPED